MLKRIQARARIEDGKIIFSDPQVFPLGTNSDVTVTIEEPRNNRSGLQNRYYWGVVIDMIHDHTGMGKEDIHAYLKKKFVMKYAVQNPNLITTTSLSTLEFEDLMEEIRLWANEEQGILIPKPNESGFYTRTEMADAVKAVDEILE